MRNHWQVFAAAALFFTAPTSIAEPAAESRSAASEMNFPQANSTQANSPQANSPQDAKSSQDGGKAHVAEEVANEVRSEVANELRPQEANTDLFALMSGRCSILNVAGRAFACRTVAYAHGTHGRAYFTIALEDPADHNHIISFSGENGRRPNQTLSVEFQAEAEGRWAAGSARRILRRNVHPAREFCPGPGFQYRLFRDRQER